VATREATGLGRIDLTKTEIGKIEIIITKIQIKTIITTTITTALPNEGALEHIMKITRTSSRQ
jgi:hypothetical protein